MKARFAIGDIVKPKSEWADDPNRLPSGRINKIAPWGKDGALYVDGDHRAFAADVFDREESEP